MAGGGATHAFNAFAAAFPLSEDGQQHQPQQHQPQPPDAGSPRDEPPTNRDPAPGMHLQQMRDECSPTNVRRLSRATATFAKRQNENERFILFLFDREEYHPFLNQQFLHELKDEEVAIDYTAVINDYPRYRRKSRGKKSLEKKKAEHRDTILRRHIAFTLNLPGLTPRAQTVNLEALENDTDVILTYITSTRKLYGKILRSKSYLSLCSSLTYLFRRYQYTTSHEFEVEMKECMEGVKNYVAMAAQLGEGNILDGDRPRTWGLYEQLNRWFYVETK